MRRRYAAVFLPIILVIIVVTIYLSPEAAAFVYGIVAFLAPLWLPALLAYLAWPLWLSFMRQRYIAGIPYAVVELVPGPDTPQTPKAMELVFYSLYHRTEITPHDFLFGVTRLSWSFEIYVSERGTRFFVRVPRSHLPAFESRIRAEYHDLGMYEVRDYAREIPFHASSMRAVMREFTLAKPDPYPLATYVSREGNDPFAEMLDELSAGAGEHFLVSYIIRPHQRERTGYFKDPSDSLHADASRAIAEILGARGELHALPPAQQSLVAAIEAGLRKPSFDCGIRALYIAERRRYDEDRARKIEGLFSRFGDGTLNEFVSRDPLSRVSFVAKEAFVALPHLSESHLVELYRRRAFFTAPYVGPAFVLNTEELATIFRLPQSARGGPAGQGAKLEPPENLPL